MGNLSFGGLFILNVQESFTPGMGVFGVFVLVSN